MDLPNLPNWILLVFGLVSLIGVLFQVRKMIKMKRWSKVKVSVVIMQFVFAVVALKFSNVEITEVKYRDIAVSTTTRNIWAKYLGAEEKTEASISSSSSQESKEYLSAVSGHYVPNFKYDTGKQFVKEVPIQGATGNQRFFLIDLPPGGIIKFETSGWIQFFPVPETLIKGARSGVNTAFSPE